MKGGREDDREAVADADTSLRACSRLFSRELAKMAMRPGEQIVRLEWGETQIAAQQRRLDRTLHIEVGDCVCRMLHLEWTMRLNSRVREQVARYHTDLVFAVRRDLRRKARHREERVEISVESVVVVLRGRKKPWPATGRYRTSSPGKPFSGVKFRIEAVYQKTVAELMARGSVFWLSFVPLARDADEDKLMRAIDLLRANADEEEFGEVLWTMLTMAQLRKKDRPSFQTMVWSAATKEEIVVHRPWFVMGLEKGRQEGLEQGIEKGIEKGIERGVEKGLKRGIKKGRQEGLQPLLYLFERRLGRPLRESEQKRIALRLCKQGPEKLGSVVLDLGKDELAAWLLPRKPTKKSAA